MAGGPVLWGEPENAQEEAEICVRRQTRGAVHLENSAPV